MVEKESRMSHDLLVEKAVRWLSGTMRCRVVLSGLASCREVPDAIGWSHRWKYQGSIVIECKTSLSDFHRDRKKKHGDRRMGTRRYFLAPADLISVESVEAHYPDHGLLYARGPRIEIVREAPARADRSVDGEVRMLQFALVHVKHNLLNRGCAVDMRELTKFAGIRGIEFPLPQAARQPYDRADVASRYPRD